MFKFIKPSAIAVGVAVLAACGGNSSPTATVSPSMAHGTLVYNPPFRIASANAATLAGATRRHRARAHNCCNSRATRPAGWTSTT